MLKYFKRTLFLVWVIAMMALLIKVIIAYNSAPVTRISFFETTVFSGFLSTFLGLPLGFLLKLMCRLVYPDWFMSVEGATEFDYLIEFISVWCIDFLAGLVWWLIIFPKIVSLFKRRE